MKGKLPKRIGAVLGIVGSAFGGLATSIIESRAAGPSTTRMATPEVELVNVKSSQRIGDGIVLEDEGARGKTLPEPECRGLDAASLGDTILTKVETSLETVGFSAASTSILLEYLEDLKKELLSRLAKKTADKLMPDESTGFTESQKEELRLHAAAILEALRPPTKHA